MKHLSFQVFISPSVYKANNYDYTADNYKVSLSMLSRSSSSRRREERSRRARSTDSLALDYELLLQNKARDTTSRNMQRLTGK